ncbi:MULTISPECIES: restriction endonuclease [unclassified Streptomyces]|uniref:restriction endonuclease n=1 Tax=unclassified Streptomyces TaxID=2593676 RepID=UPI00380ECAE6
MTRRPRRRRSTGGWAALPWWVWGLLGLAGAVALGRATVLWPWQSAAIAGMATAGLGARPGQRALRRWQARRPLPVGTLRYSLAQLDRLGDREFEHAVCALLRRDGLSARHTGGAGDKGADVIARDGAGRKVVVQCKRWRADRRVGDQDIQRINGTYRHDHGAAFAIVVTTGGFTAPARTGALRYGIHLVDRPLLERWSYNGEPLYGVLGIISHKGS